MKKLQNPKFATFCRIMIEGKKRAAVIEDLKGEGAFLRLMNSQTKVIAHIDELLEF